MTSIEDSRKRDYETFDGETQLEEPCSVPPEYEYVLNEQSQVGIPTPNPLLDHSEGRSSPMGASVVIPARRLSSSANSPSAFAAMKGNSAPPAKKTKLSYKEKLAEEELLRINKEIEEQEAAERKARKEAEENRPVSAIQDAKPTPKKDQPKVDAKTPKDTEKPAADKRVRRTKSEMEEARLAKEAEAKEKCAETEKKRAAKEAEAEEKRLAKEAEAEGKRLAREAEAEEKRAAKAAKEEEKRLKDEKKKEKDEAKRLKDEEKQKKEEEQRKKDKAQLTLGNFFAIPAPRSRSNSVDSHKGKSMSPAPSQHTVAATSAPTAFLTPSKPRLTPYDDLFPTFYKKDDVTVAPINRFGRDKEATEFLEKTIDGYLSGTRLPDTQRCFSAMTLFQMNFSDGFVPRGREYVPVREIMSEYHPGSSSRMAIDLTTTDSQNSQIRRTSDLLRKIPLKILHFQEDVRPPYKGTYTKTPITSTQKLARNPLRKDLPDTNYDYDSEAEWVEDDGEDLHSDGDDEEEDGDGEEMDGFLDDENDESANSRRLVMQGDLEPISTGLCWEDRSKRNSNVKMVKYRMEIIVDPKLKSIDPFSTSYWQPVLLPMDPPRLPLHTMKSTSVIQNQNATPTSSKTVKPFFSAPSPTDTKTTSPSASSTPTPKAPQAKVDKDGKLKKMIAAEDLPAFKAALLGDDVNTLSKVGLIEVLKKRFPGRAAAAIKNTLEVVAERVGQKEKDKRWVLIAGVP